MTEFNFDGSVITEPGIYKDLPIETYHHNPFLCDGPSISSTGLRQLIDRPSLYWANSPYNSKRIESDTKKHFQFGKAAHMLLLGEDGFAEQYALRPDTYPDDPKKKWNANSLSCKGWLQEADDAGKDVITQDQLDTIQHMRDSLAAHPVVRGGILNGSIERSILMRWGNGFWLRARPDVIPAGSGDFGDLKTVADIRYESLEKSIFNFGYHVQAALVRLAAKSVFEKSDGWQFGGFAFVFIEKTPPFDVRVVQLRDEDMDLGEQQIRLAMDTINQCVKRWQWPGEEGFSQTVNQIGIPSWARTRIMNEIEIKESEIAA